MFEEDDEDFYDGNLNEDISRFEAHLNGHALGYLDSDQCEAIIDHYLINSQYTKAASAADFAMNQFPYNALFHLRKAQAISALGNLKEGLSLLAKIEKWETPSCEFLLTKASIFSQLHDHKFAIRLFKEALSISEPEDRDEIYLDLAMEYQNDNDYKNAVKILKEAIQYNPKNEGAIYEIAFCYDQLNQFEDAIKAYHTFIDENPYSFTSWYNLGNTYLKLEKYDKAIWAYDYCLLINEDFAPAYFNLGNVYLTTEKYKLAIQHFHKSIEVDGDDPIAFCYIGECHEQLGEYDLAKHFYKRSMELAPMYADSWLGMGIVLDLEEKTKEGLTFILKAVELDPENPSVYHVLAGAYEKLEDWENASENYVYSLALDPMEEECLTNYVDLLASFSKVDALNYLRDFKENIAKNKIAPILEVNLLYTLGRKEEACVLFAQCVLEDYEKAKSILDLYPELVEAKEIILLLNNN